MTAAKLRSPGRRGPTTRSERLARRPSADPGPGGMQRAGLKILYHHRTASKDGQAVHIEELIAAFRRRGHEVIVVGPKLSEGQSFGGESRAVGLLKRYLPGAAYELLEAAYSLAAYRRLVRAWRRHAPDVLYERFNLFLLAGAWLRRRHGIPYFLEVNAPLLDERRRYGGLALERLAEWSQNTVWRAADAVLPVTGVLAGDLRRAGVPEERIAVIPNGVDPDSFLAEIDGTAARARLGLEGQLVLGFTGFIRSWHGLDTVVDLIAQSHPARDLFLLVVGDGPGRQDLVARIRRLGVSERVRLVGLVDRASMPHYVTAFDIALQPAATPYASPLKLFEYMALGRAIVAPRQPNIEEVLTHDDSALLFTPGDAHDFRAQVERLCADPALRQRLGAAARRTLVERDLTWDGNARRIETLFARTLDRALDRGKR